MIREVTERELRFGHMLYKQRSVKEKDAFMLLPISMQKSVQSNYPVAFTEYDYAYFPDFLLSKEKVIIEIDGFKWHRKRVEQDRIRDDIFTDNGFVVVRIPASKVDNPFDFWFTLFCGFAKIERKDSRESISEYIDDLNVMVEQLALTWRDAML